nr:hypothetical protein [Candidatus Sigynarchaeota archaeon]
SFLNEKLHKLVEPVYMTFIAIMEHYKALSKEDLLAIKDRLQQGSFNLNDLFPDRFFINDHLSLQRIGNQTGIFVDGMPFSICKHLVINIPEDQVQQYDAASSMDEIIDISKKSSDSDNEDEIFAYDLNLKDEFWGHCSNLQAWVDNGYDTHLLASNLAFPLLKALADMGDKAAENALKGELVARIRSGYQPTIRFLALQGFFRYLSPGDVKELGIEKNVQECYACLFSAEVLDEVLEITYKNSEKELDSNLEHFLDHVFINVDLLMERTGVKPDTEIIQELYENLLKTHGFYDLHLIFETTSIFQIIAKKYGSLPTQKSLLRIYKLLFDGNMIYEIQNLVKWSNVYVPDDIIPDELNDPKVDFPEFYESITNKELPGSFLEKRYHYDKYWNPSEMHRSRRDCDIDRASSLYRIRKLVEMLENEILDEKNLNLILTSLVDSMFDRFGDSENFILHELVEALNDTAIKDEDPYRASQHMRCKKLAERLQKATGAYIQQIYKIVLYHMLYSIRPLWMLDLFRFYGRRPDPETFRVYVSGNKYLDISFLKGFNYIPAEPDLQKIYMKILEHSNSSQVLSEIEELQTFTGHALVINEAVIQLITNWPLCDKFKLLGKELFTKMIDEEVKRLVERALLFQLALTKKQCSFLDELKRVYEIKPTPSSIEKLCIKAIEIRDDRPIIMFLHTLDDSARTRVLNCMEEAFNNAIQNCEKNNIIKLFISILKQNGRSINLPIQLQVYYENLDDDESSFDDDDNDNDRYDDDDRDDEDNNDDDGDDDDALCNEDRQ